MQPKYVNPFTDFGFKKIFGEEASKFLLLDFLNALLPAESRIKNLSFKNTEQLGRTAEERKAVYDIYCETDNGEKIIVELQKAKQNYFKERTIYYSTFPIREQGEKGEWNYNLKAVFCIGILDFKFDDYTNDADKSKVLHEIKLRNRDGKTFYEKLTYLYLEMPNFNKTEAELETRLDKWLYFIKHLNDFQSIPQIFRNEVVFIEAFDKAALAKYDEQERANYEYSLKVYRDFKNVIDTAVGEAAIKNREEGKIEGIKEGINKVANSMKKSGMHPDEIHKLTGLTKEEIERL